MRRLLFVLLLGCSSSSSKDPSGNEPGKYASAPAMSIDTSKSYKASIVTAKGTIEIALDAKAAPGTVNNFVFLAKDRFYDGLTFHRVEPGFVIQGGDPSGDGSGGPGYTIADEQSGLLHDEGVIAMAKTEEPNSAGSQFYVTLGAQHSLDGRYTVFGKVTAGQDVPGKIAKGDVITRITITE